MATRSVIRPIAIIRFAVLALLLAFTAYTFFFAEWRPRSLADVQDTFNHVGPYAPLVAVFIQIVAVILFIPGFLLVLGTALIFHRDSIWISMVGQTLGAAACFFIARFLGRDYLRSLMGPRVVHMERILEEHGLKYLIYMRFLGIVPLPLLSYGPGLVHIRFRQFLIATTIGEAPLIIVLGLFGASVARIRGLSDVWDFEFLFPAALLVVLYTVPMVVILTMRRIQRRRSKTATPASQPHASAVLRSQPDLADSGK